MTDFVLIQVPAPKFIESISLVERQKFRFVLAFQINHPAAHDSLSVAYFSTSEGEQLVPRYQCIVFIGVILADLSDQWKGYLILLCFGVIACESVEPGAPFAADA